MGVNNSLLKSMQTIVDKAIEVAPFDKTRQAQVITNNADGTYTIRLDGILYNNVPSYPETSSISAGSVVKIITPSNQPSQMFIQSLKGGGGGDHVELTQSQYNALTPSQKTDGTVYFVTDGDSECFIMSDSVPVGAIQAFGGRVAPEGWLICNGRALNRETYSELFDAIGTTYGAGDGSTTFNIPDFRGRTAIGVNTDHVLGSSGGEETHLLLGREAAQKGITTPAGGGHSHPVNTRKDNQTGKSAERLGNSSSGNSINPIPGGTGTHTHTINAEDADNPHNNMQPYIVINYIIKAFQPPTDNVIKSLDPDHLLLDAFYPVGSEYSTINSAFNPNITWGGTWTSEEMFEDYIIEEGTSGIWTYRKWSSGISECWGRRGSTSYAMTSASGYAYYSYFTQTLPSGLFTSITSALSARCGGTSSQALISTNIFTINTTQFQCFIWQPASGTQNVDVAFNIKGLWKTYEAPKTVYKWIRTA